MPACCCGELMYGDPVIGVRVTAGMFCVSWIVDSGYIPLAGRILRSVGSLVGCDRFDAEGCERA